jgi:hypothetical protein
MGMRGPGESDSNVILRIADQTQEAIHDGLPKSRPELARRYDLAPRVDGMNLKDHFRQIETNGRDSGEIPDRLRAGCGNLDRTISGFSA